MNRNPLCRRDVEELREFKRLFDYAWWSLIAMACVALILPWYLGLNPLDISPAVALLIAMTVVQLFLNDRAQRNTSAARLQMLAALSQGLGLLGMGIIWHLMGGLQNPTFAAFILLPLLLGPLVLNTWQQYCVLGLSWMLLFSAIVLAPNINSFIDERYGIRLLHSGLLSAWLPKSRSVFPEVTTTPPYDLLMLVTYAITGWALHATSAAITKIVARTLNRNRSLQADKARSEHLIDDLIAHSTSPEILVASTSGKIVKASRRFAEYFELAHPAEGQYLLDAIDFHYPEVIKRLIRDGGDDIQGARVKGRQMMLRIRAGPMSRAGTMSRDDAPLSRMSVEQCEDRCWRGALDAMEEMVLAIDSEGGVCFVNEAASELFGEPSGAPASDVLRLDGIQAPWWDIAPLDFARRSLTLRKRNFVAIIRRKRIAAGIGAITYVILQERAQTYAVA